MNKRTSKNSIKRVVAKKAFSVIDENSKDIELTDHEVLSFSIMEAAVTPKINITPKFEMKDLGKKPVSLVLDGKSTQVIRVSTVTPKNPTEPFKGVLEYLNKECLKSLNITGPSKLVLNKMVTRHKDTGSICGWHRTALKDFDGHKVYRLQLRSIDGANADEVNTNRVMELGIEMMDTVCRMKKAPDTYKCSYEK